MPLANSLQCGGNRIVSIYQYNERLPDWAVQTTADTSGGGHQLTETLVKAHSWQKIEHHEMGLFSDVIPFAVGRSLNDVLRHSDVHPLQFGRP